MILSQIWYITELVGYTSLLWSKICTLPHMFLLRFAWWRRWWSTGVLWRTWWIASPLWWNMRWLRPHDFKHENAHENFTFVWPCIVTNFFIIKPTRCTILQIYSGVKLYMFWTVPSWSCSNAVYKPVWHTPLPSVQWINSWWWTEELSETCRVSWQNKFVKLVHLVGFIIKKAHENINFLVTLFQLQRLYSITLHRYKITHGK
jgi:hypothetical protein